MAQITRIIYVGPSLYGVKLERRDDELWRPPARSGDIMRDARESAPKCIVLIDGVFHQELSVWHKELVWALLEGIWIIGGASMGALRAAELYRYGAIGVGRIYEMYVQGEEDDSLVALTYDETTFRPLSDAPIGQALKQADASEALAFARSLDTSKPVVPKLDKSALSPYLEIILERIKANG